MRSCSGRSASGSASGGVSGGVSVTSAKPTGTPELRTRQAGARGSVPARVRGPSDC
jgi:hypothetical protein